MKLIDRILEFLFGETVSVTCPKCDQVIDTHLDAVEVIKKHGCIRCQLKERRKLDREVGTED